MNIYQVDVHIWYKIMRENVYFAASSSSLMVLNDQRQAFHIWVLAKLYSTTFLYTMFYLILFHHISLLLVVNISSAFFLSQHSKVIPSCWCDNYSELGMGKRYESSKCASFNNIYPMLSPGTPYKVC